MPKIVGRGVRFLEHLTGGAVWPCEMQTSATSPETHRPRWRSRWKRYAKVFLLLVAAWLVWFWPARRNYYSGRHEVDYRLDVSYEATQADPKRAIDLYLPRGTTKPFPMVVFVHGGYWSPLDRRWLQPILGAHGNVGVAFARAGVGAAIIGYRQFPQIQTGDDSLIDITKAVRFVRDSCASWQCDARQIYLVGHSAGGHLVSLLALDEHLLAREGIEASSIAGYISIDGIFDLPASLSAFGPEQSRILQQLFGPDTAALRAHSPLTYARAHHPRLLFVDSANDEKVCVEGFRAMKSRMTEVASPAVFTFLPGLGHNEALIRIGMDPDPVLPVLLDFIRHAEVDSAPH